MEGDGMEYTPGRVYRHKSRMAKKYLKRQQVGDLLFDCFGLVMIVAFAVLFVGWWIA